MNRAPLGGIEPPSLSYGIHPSRATIRGHRGESPSFRLSCETCGIGGHIVFAGGAARLPGCIAPAPAFDAPAAAVAALRAVAAVRGVPRGEVDAAPAGVGQAVFLFSAGHGYSSHSIFVVVT